MFADTKECIVESNHRSGNVNHSMGDGFSMFFHVLPKHLNPACPSDPPPLQLPLSFLRASTFLPSVSYKLTVGKYKRLIWSKSYYLQLSSWKCMSFWIYTHVCFLAKIRQETHSLQFEEVPWLGDVCLMSPPTSDFYILAMPDQPDNNIWKTWPTKKTPKLRATSLNKIHNHGNNTSVSNAPLPATCQYTGPLLHWQGICSPGHLVGKGHLLITPPRNLEKKLGPKKLHRLASLGESQGV